MLTDPVHQHLFITSGTGSSSILVTGYSGQALAAGGPGQSPAQRASCNLSPGTATVLAPEEYPCPAGNLRSMQITPDGKDVAAASGAPCQQPGFQGGRPQHGGGV